MIKVVRGSTIIKNNYETKKFISRKKDSLFEQIISGYQSDEMITRKGLGRNKWPSSRNRNPTYFRPNLS